MRQVPRSLVSMAVWPGQLPRHFERPHSRMAWCRKALCSNGIPSKIVVDKSGANAAGIREVNKILNRFGCPAKIQTVRSKFLNKMIEQDHRFVKRRIRHMRAFKSFRSALATLDGIEVTNIIRRQQFPSTTTSGFLQFTEIAGLVRPISRYSGHSISLQHIPLNHTLLRAPSPFMRKIMIFRSLNTP